MYNTVSQVDCEVTFNLPNSDTARSFRLMSFSQDTNYLGRGHQDSALTDTPNCGEVEVDSNDASTSPELSDDDPRRFQRSKMAVGYCSPRLRTTSNAVPVPLSHPTPGLHSLQGACTGNVEDWSKRPSA